MQSIKVAEIFAEMGLNLDERSVAKITKQFEKIGKKNAKSVEKPMKESVGGVEKSMDFITKSLKGFIAFSAITTAFNFATNSAKEMNEELQKGIGFVGDLDDLSTSLGLSFKQAQQLDISAQLGGMSGGGELYKIFSKFQENLTALKSGENTDATSILQNILGDKINQENDFELFGRLISSNKYLDKGTASKNIKTVFGETNAKQSKYLQGEGADLINQAYGRKDLYISDKKKEEYGEAEKTLIINNLENRVKDINSLDISKQLKSSLESTEFNHNIKEVKEKVSVVADKVTELTNESVKFYKSDKSIFSPSFYSSNYATKPRAN